MNEPQMTSDSAAAANNPTLRFEGRVAVITGAAGGLGRAHALLLARRGACIVVNDLGTTVEGARSSEPCAESVAAEIRAAGGQAIADASSIAEPDGARALINRALEAYGRIDILVNNAGILRDRSFAKMPLTDFEHVLAVHLLGSVYVTKAAWPHMHEQRYGRIVLTTSDAGLYGNFGQTNYAAAKLALVGFMNALKLEGRKHNILVNTIAPLAATRMAEGTVLDALAKFLKPERVSAIVAWLCHERLVDSGLILCAGGGYLSRVRLMEGRGVRLDAEEEGPGEAHTPERIMQIWDRALDMSESRGFEEAQEAVACRFPLVNKAMIKR